LRQPSKQQIQEWAESPVNEFLVKAIEKYCVELNEGRGVNAYAPGDPHRTQESLALLNGELSAWGDIIEVLGGVTSLFTEEEDDGN